MARTRVAMGRSGPWVQQAHGWAKARAVALAHRRIVIGSWLLAITVALAGCSPSVLAANDAAPLDGSRIDGALRDMPSIFSEKGVPLLDAKADVNPNGQIFYVRPGGGDPKACTGLANVDYPGSGVGQACAFAHPFHALPPVSGGKPRLKGGDWLVIAKGSYRMGLGAKGAETCLASCSWDCHMQPVPSGPSPLAPTRILGEGFDSGCASPPELYGVERAWRILDLTKGQNIQIQCLEITDHSACVESHSGGAACNRNSAPYGDWVPLGLYAVDSRNVVLRRLNIHGLGHAGIHAGRLRDWLVEDVRIAGNGWVGWDGDLGATTADSSNSGTLFFRRVTIEWNGCGETYPGGKPTACWGQSAGGYGDGLGTAATAGDWVFEDSRFLHNTSDGLDLLYHQLGGNIVLKRVLAEGNAGNQIKVTGKNILVENSVMIGNCAYFKDKTFTYNVDHCRALGNTFSIGFQSGTQVKLINSSLYGQGDVLVVGSPRLSTCNGSETVVTQNSIFVGDQEFLAPFENAALYYFESCQGLKLTGDYNVAYKLKGTCTLGSHDLCQDPKLGMVTGDTIDLKPQSGSCAVDSGLKVGGDIPDHDLLKQKRPKGAGVDRGAYEVQ